MMVIMSGRVKDRTSLIKGGDIASPNRNLPCTKPRPFLMSCLDYAQFTARFGDGLLRANLNTTTTTMSQFRKRQHSFSSHDDGVELAYLGALSAKGASFFVHLWDRRRYGVHLLNNRGYEEVNTWFLYVAIQDLNPRSKRKGEISGYGRLSCATFSTCNANNHVMYSEPVVSSRFRVRVFSRKSIYPDVRSAYDRAPLNGLGPCHRPFRHPCPCSCRSHPLSQGVAECPIFGPVWPYRIYQALDLGVLRRWGLFHFVLACKPPPHLLF